MKYPRKNRLSIRLQNYDYSQPAAYFITICTRHRKCLFGDVVGEQMKLNRAGCIVKQTWQQMPGRFPAVELDVYTVMPNHFHGIVILRDKNAPALGEIVRTFKALVTYRLRKEKILFAWQRNYYEHVVRNEKDLQDIREYIVNNHLKWPDDENHPSNIK